MKGENYMTEKEKAILDNISKLLPNVSEEQKEYILGLTDGMAIASYANKEQKKADIQKLA